MRITSKQLRQRIRKLLTETSFSKIDTNDNSAGVAGVIFHYDPANNSCVLVKSADKEINQYTAATTNAPKFTDLFTDFHANTILDAMQGQSFARTPVVGSTDEFVEGSSPVAAAIKNAIESLTSKGYSGRRATSNPDDTPTAAVATFGSERARTFQQGAYFFKTTTQAANDVLNTLKSLFAQGAGTTLGTYQEQLGSQLIVPEYGEDVFGETFTNVTNTNKLGSPFPASFPSVDLYAGNNPLQNAIKTSPITGDQTLAGVYASAKYTTGPGYYAHFETDKLFQVFGLMCGTNESNYPQESAIRDALNDRGLNQADGDGNYPSLTINYAFCTSRSATPIKPERSFQAVEDGGDPKDYIEGESVAMAMGLKNPIEAFTYKIEFNTGNFKDAVRSYIADWLANSSTANHNIPSPATSGVKFKRLFDDVDIPEDETNVRYDELQDKIETYVNDIILKLMDALKETYVVPNGGNYTSVKEKDDNSHRLADILALGSKRPDTRPSSYTDDGTWENANKAALDTAGNRDILGQIIARGLIIKPDDILGFDKGTKKTSAFVGRAPPRIPTQQTAPAINCYLSPKIPIKLQYNEDEGRYELYNSSDEMIQNGYLGYVCGENPTFSGYGGAITHLKAGPLRNVCSVFITSQEGEAVDFAKSLAGFANSTQDYIDAFVKSFSNVIVGALSPYKDVALPTQYQASGQYALSNVPTVSQITAAGRQAADQDPSIQQFGYAAGIIGLVAARMDQQIRNMQAGLSSLQRLAQVFKTQLTGGTSASAQQSSYKALLTTTGGGGQVANYSQASAQFIAETVKDLRDSNAETDNALRTAVLAAQSIGGDPAFTADLKAALNNNKPTGFTGDWADEMLGDRVLESIIRSKIRKIIYESMGNYPILGDKLNKSMSFDMSKINLDDLGIMKYFRYGLAAIAFLNTLGEPAASLYMTGLESLLGVESDSVPRQTQKPAFSPPPASGARRLLDPPSPGGLQEAKAYEAILKKILYTVKKKR